MNELIHKSYNSLHNDHRTDCQMSTAEIALPEGVPECPLWLQTRIIFIIDWSKGSKEACSTTQALVSRVPLQAILLRLHMGFFYSLPFAVLMLVPYTVG